MESIIAALITGVLTLVGVTVSNSHSRAVMEARIDALAERVEKHNCLIERTYLLERNVAVAQHDIDVLLRKEGGKTEFLTGNDWQHRLGRTVVQGVPGAVVANLDPLLGWATRDPTWRALCVALVIAVLSPVMAEPGAATTEKGKAMSDEGAHGRAAARHRSRALRGRSGRVRAGGR